MAFFLNLYWVFAQEMEVSVLFHCNMLMQWRKDDGL